MNSSFIFHKSVFLSYMFMALLILSCEETKNVEEVPTPTPPIVIEPEVFPGLGYDGPYLSLIHI